jgi:hypothetical protein
MKNRFILFQRSGVYYCEDTTTRKQTSLRTKDKADAVRLLHAKNEAVHQPAMNLQIAQVYLHHSDPALSARTWQHVLDTMIDNKSGSNLLRWQGAVKDKALAPLRDRKLIETSGELFPTLARLHERHRAKMFTKRLKTVGISGVSLHSYRYAWLCNGCAAVPARTFGCRHHWIFPLALMRCIESLVGKIVASKTGREL